MITTCLIGPAAIRCTVQLYWTTRAEPYKLRASWSSMRRCRRSLRFDRLTELVRARRGQRVHSGECSCAAGAVGERHHRIKDVSVDVAVVATEVGAGRSAVE